MDPPPGRFRLPQQSRTTLQTLGKSQAIQPRLPLASGNLKRTRDPVLKLLYCSPVLQVRSFRAILNLTCSPMCLSPTNYSRIKRQNYYLASKVPKICRLTLLATPAPTAWPCSSLLLTSTYQSIWPLPIGNTLKSRSKVTCKIRTQLILLSTICNELLCLMLKTSISTLSGLVLTAYRNQSFSDCVAARSTFFSSATPSSVGMLWKIRTAKPLLWTASATKMASSFGGQEKQNSIDNSPAEPFSQSRGRSLDLLSQILSSNPIVLVWAASYLPWRVKSCRARPRAKTLI